MKHNLSLNDLIKKTNVHRPLMFHSILWSLAFTILIFVFTKGKTPVGIDGVYTLVILLLLVVPACINFYGLIPKFLKKEHYVIYLLTFLLNMLVFSFIISHIFQPLLNTLFPSYFFISYLNKTNISIVVIIFLVASSLLKLAEDWFYFNKKQNEILRTKTMQIQTHLSALRSQINPHFLFNALNVIYAMALDKKEKITDAILQLSNVLRYVIYGSDNERVLLKDEIKLLKNYIAFQKHRSSKSEMVYIKITIKNKDYKIYPMLLLPLLENAFKYGVSSTKNDNPIKIIIEQHIEYFRFQITNSKVNIDLGLDKNYSGIGLKTLQENLNLVYPKQHKLLINDTETSFEVILKLFNDKR